MSMRSFESGICWELREITGVRSLRVKDIMEWSTGAVKVVEGEVQFSLPIAKVNCSVKLSALGKQWQRANAEKPQPTNDRPEEPQNKSH